MFEGQRNWGQGGRGGKWFALVVKTNWRGGLLIWETCWGGKEKATTKKWGEQDFEKKRVLNGFAWRARGQPWRASVLGLETHIVAWPRLNSEKGISGRKDKKKKKHSQAHFATGEEGKPANKNQSN